MNRWLHRGRCGGSGGAGWAGESTWCDWRLRIQDSRGAGAGLTGGRLHVIESHKGGHRLRERGGQSRQIMILHDVDIGNGHLAVAVEIGIEIASGLGFE